MSKATDSFRDKRFRYGAFSTFMALIVIAILVVINLVAGQLNTPVDMTRDKYYSVSQETKAVLAALEEDVNIYTLYKTGQEVFFYTRILEQYPIASSRVKLINRDPDLYPRFVRDHAEDGRAVETGSIIVENAATGKSRLIPASDLQTAEFDYYSLSQKLVSIDIEPQVTNAVYYVTLAYTPNVYVLSGHGETELPENLIRQFSTANLNVKNLDIVNADIPSDCDVLLAAQPNTADWTEEEAAKVTAYLQNSGRAVFIAGYSPVALPNMDSVLYHYGLTRGQFILLEGDTNHYMSSPVELIPDYTEAEAAANVAAKANKMLAIMPTYIAAADIVRASLETEPLLTTSVRAFAKTNGSSETVNKEPGDIDGPFALAVSVTDTFVTANGTLLTKLVLVSCDGILAEGANSRCRGANWDFITEACNWLQDKTDTLYVGAKSATTTTGVLTGLTSQGQKNLITGISAVGIPVIILLAGLFWWLRRRHS